MRGLYQPVLAGLVVSSVLAVLLFFWILLGGLHESNVDLDTQYSNLIAQRADLVRELSELSSEDMCEMVDGSPSFSEGMLPPLGENFSFDASVVWMIARSSLGVTTGSGFFISDRHVVTNYHVIQDLDADAVVYVAARGHGFVEGNVSFYGKSDFGASDLAVITLKAPVFWAKPLLLHDSSGNTDLRLQNVISAGYPGAVIENYRNLDNMLSGNVDDLPQLVLTSGVISSNANNQLSTQIISHTAQISQGNSGGPLVNRCGAVIGVNTFIYSGKDGVRSFAIGSETLRSFLAKGDLSYSLGAEDCDL